MTRIGLISDTHGLLRPDALAFLKGSDYIVHAGDICDEAVLTTLRALAPLTVVRGNNDHGLWADDIPVTATLKVDEVQLLVIHDLKDLAPEPTRSAAQVVVAGHSHKPMVERRQHTWFINPGSAGPRRFKLPISIGELILDGGKFTARVVDLESGMTLHSTA
jgi:putative phosphoesterase